MNEQRTFIGWQVQGIDPVSSREEGGKIICLESASVLWFKILMGLLFGPAITAALLHSVLKDHRTPLLAVAFMGFFSLIAWGALIQATLRRRRIVFDAHAGSVDLRAGWTSLKRISRTDIAALELSKEPRTTTSSHGAAISWTGYVVTANLKSGEAVPLFESSKEETIRGLYSRINRAFFQL